jgi:DnaJ-domain-containing protein 1
MQSNTQKENLVRIPVTIELMDGRKESVNLISPRALLKLYELVNREEQFLDVEALDGERFAIAKSAVKAIRNRNIPQAKDLNATLAADDKNGFDPYAILHVNKEDTAEAIHKAYLALVRDYHPDRFASIGLPKEINEYLTASIRRINVAYDMLQKTA